MVQGPEDYNLGLSSIEESVELFNVAEENLHLALRVYAEHLYTEHLAEFYEEEATIFYDRATTLFASAGAVMLLSQQDIKTKTKKEPYTEKATAQFAGFLSGLKNERLNQYNAILGEESFMPAVDEEVETERRRMAFSIVNELRNYRPEENSITQVLCNAVQTVYMLYTGPEYRTFMKELKSRPQTS